MESKGLSFTSQKAIFTWAPLMATTWNPEVERLVSEYQKILSRPAAEAATEVLRTESVKTPPPDPAIMPPFRHRRIRTKQQHFSSLGMAKSSHPSRPHPAEREEAAAAAELARRQEEETAKLAKAQAEAEAAENAEAQAQAERELAAAELERQEAEEERHHGSLLSEFSPGNAVQYYSTTHCGFIDAIVERINYDGTLDLDVREDADIKQVRLKDSAPVKLPVKDACSWDPPKRDNDSGRLQASAAWILTAEDINTYKRQIIVSTASDEDPTGESERARE
jgi:hypothetical protein